jgi:aquaporin Z
MGKSIAYGAAEVGPQRVTAAIAGEAVTTFCLIRGLFIFLGSHSLRRFTPIIIPPLYAVMIVLEAGMSGISTNLARSLGPAVISGWWSGFYVYIIGPAAGVIAAIMLRKMKIFRSFEVEVAKLYRFSKDPYHVLGKSPFE